MKTLRLFIAIIVLPLIAFAFTVPDSDEKVMQKLGSVEFTKIELDTMAKQIQTRATLHTLTSATLK